MQTNKTMVIIVEEDYLEEAGAIGHDCPADDYSGFIA